MKKSINNKKEGVLILFLQIFGTLFVGFSLCNIFAVTIDCLINGFDCFFLRLVELPYLIYLVFSLIISLVLLLIIHKKTK